MVGRVIAHDVDQWRPGPPRVVQVGQAVAESGSQVEQSGRRLFRHAGVAVGRTRGDTLEEREDCAHFGHRIECGDEVHLGRPGIAEAGIDARTHQSGQKRMSSVHGCSPRDFVRTCPRRPRRPRRRRCHRRSPGSRRAADRGRGDRRDRIRA